MGYLSLIIQTRWHNQTRLFSRHQSIDRLSHQSIRLNSKQAIISCRLVSKKDSRQVIKRASKQLNSPSNPSRTSCLSVWSFVKCLSSGIKNNLKCQNEKSIRFLGPPRTRLWVRQNVKWEGGGYEPLPRPPVGGSSLRSVPSKLCVCAEPESINRKIPLVYLLGGWGFALYCTVPTLDGCDPYDDNSALSFSGSTNNCDVVRRVWRDGRLISRIWRGTFISCVWCCAGDLSFAYGSNLVHILISRMVTACLSLLVENTGNNFSIVRWVNS